MPAKKIDGNAIAKSIREDISAQIAATQANNPKFQPSLAIIQVGERPDSTSYVNMKAKAAADAKINFQHIKLAEDTNEAAVSNFWFFCCVEPNRARSLRKSTSSTMMSQYTESLSSYLFLLIFPSTQSLGL